MGLITQAVLALSLGAAMVGADTGYAVRYAPNRMERTAAIRQIVQQACMVAWTAATDADIGETWLTVQGPAGRRRCLVVDLPQARDKPSLVRRDILVELDYESGRAICGAQWRGKASECRVLVQSTISTPKK